jgi:predicted ATPase
VTVGGAAAGPLPLLDMTLPAGGTGYPLGLPAFSGLGRLTFDSPITLFVGENGSGKSTLLEALALAAEVPSAGPAEVGGDATLSSVAPLADALRLGWSRRSSRGVFFRAEDFFAYERRLEAMRRDLMHEAERVAVEKHEAGEGEVRRAQAPFVGQAAALRTRLGGEAFSRSHGESFIAFFHSRVQGPGLYLLDEVEAALSPTRQLAFLALLKDAVTAGAQIVMATHAPILLAAPGATIWSFDHAPAQRVAYDELEHVRLTRAFLADPQAYLRRL